MSNSSTEEIGVNYLKTVLAKTHVVTTNGILTGDKEISWDGHFSVFRGDAGKKELFLGNIPVQVKTIHQDNNNNRFSIDKVDLINYRTEGRVMYFYITLDKHDEATIFYLSLMLWDIDKILREIGDNMSKTCTLRALV